MSSDDGGVSSGPLFEMEVKMREQIKQLQVRYVP